MQAHGASPLPLTARLRAEGLQEGGGLGVQQEPGVWVVGSHHVLMHIACLSPLERAHWDAGAKVVLPTPVQS